MQVEIAYFYANWNRFKILSFLLWNEVKVGNKPCT